MHDGLRKKVRRVFCVNTFSIATTDEMTVDKTYDPNENRGWWERNWLSVLLIGVQLVAGLIMCFIPCMQGVG